MDSLRSELAFGQEQEREIEHDVAMLKESNRILHFAFQQQQQKQQGGARVAQHDCRDPRDILADEKKRQESAQLQHEQIAHLRSHMEKLRVEKSKLQQRQKVLFDKQRSAEQDRNRLLGTLQDERSSINQVRQDRLRLWEERSKLERQMAQIVRDTQANANSNIDTWQPVAQTQGSAPGSQGGVRSQPTRDMPQAFDDDFGPRPPNPADFGTGGSQRTGWTGFGDDKAAGAGRADSAATNNASSGLGRGFPGGAFGVGSTSGQGNASSGPPPSFGDLVAGNANATGNRGGGGGLGEWADKQRGGFDSSRL